MSARRNTTLGNTARGARSRLPALLDLDAQAAAVGGPRPGWRPWPGWRPLRLSEDELKEVARCLSPADLRNASAVDQSTRRTFAKFFAFARKYNLEHSKDHRLGLILVLDLTRADLYGEGEGDGYKMLLNDLRDSGTEYLRVECTNREGQTQKQHQTFWEVASESQEIKDVKHLHVTGQMYMTFPMDLLFKGVRIFTSLKFLYIFCDDGWVVNNKIPS